MISQNFEIFNAKKTVNGLEQPITQTQGYIDIYNQKVKLKNGIEFELNPEFYALNQINRNQDVWVLRLDFYNWFEVDQNKSKAPKKQRIPVFVRKEKDEWISQVDNQSLHRHKIVLKNTNYMLPCY